MPYVNPKLRPVHANPIEHQGRPSILLRDPLSLSERLLVVPEELGPLLALCDGTRDAAGLRAAVLVHTGINLPIELVRRVIEQLDSALLLENERFEDARRAALDEYHALPARRPSSAGRSYPADPAELRQYLDAFRTAARQNGHGAQLDLFGARGVVCPHIDYGRGGPVYATTWEAVADAARLAERVIVFGTDHMGGDGRLTLTRQNYSTPLGTLPTDQEIVHYLAIGLGEEQAFEDELHHLGEHSIELAAVWLHHVRDGRPCRLVPILCGGFEGFVNGGMEPELQPELAGAFRLLRQVADAPRTLVIAAADMAHVGPAFGDVLPLDYTARLRLEMSDAALIQQICGGGPSAFLDEIRRVNDKNRVCGVPPIYATLSTLGASTGHRLAYAQCPADEGGGSWVSIAGIALV